MAALCSSRAVALMTLRSSRRLRSACCCLLKRSYSNWLCSRSSWFLRVWISSERGEPGVGDRRGYWASLSALFDLQHEIVNVFPKATCICLKWIAPLIKERKAKPSPPQKPKSTKLRHRHINKQEKQSVLDSTSSEKVEGSVRWPAALWSLVSLKWSKEEASRILHVSKMKKAAHLSGTQLSAKQINHDLVEGIIFLQN